MHTIVLIISNQIKLCMICSKMYDVNDKEALEKKYY